MIRRLFTHRVGRFMVIGFCNATISFGLLNLAYYQLHQTKIVSSIIATSCALIFSFIMNRNFVFRDKEKRVHEQLPAFTLVTISGTLLVLNLVYILSLKLLSGHEQLISEPIRTITGIVLSDSFVAINLSTVAGAMVAIFWNYNGYKWFVFKGKTKDAAEAIKNTL